MPNIKSAEKRLRQSKKRTERNREAKSAMRTVVKKARGAIAAGDQAGAEESVKAAAKKIDTIARKGIIHKNSAARKKSRLASLYNKTFQKA